MLARSSFFSPWLWGLILLHLLVWTIAPILSGYAPALDAIEMHSWSLMPQWGYYKHPPLPAWIIAASEMVLGKTPIALILPSMLSVIAAYAAIWCLAKRILAPRLAVVALYLSATSFFYQLWAVSFNHNVVQIPLWAWTLTLLYQALIDGYKRYWLMLGIVFGFTILAKYTAVLLILPAVLFIWLTPSVRKNIGWGHVCYMLVPLAIIISPHVLWLIHHHFDSLHYASARMGESGHWDRGFIGFITTAILAHSAMFMALFCVCRDSVKKNTEVLSLEKSRFLFLLGLGPLLQAILIGLSGQTLAPMWSMAMLPLSGILLVYWYNELAKQLYQWKWLLAWLIFQCLVVSAFLFKGQIGYYHLTTRSSRIHYPAQPLVQQITVHWQQSFPGRPLRYVAGPIWEAGLVSFYASDTPYVIPDGNLSAVPWVDPENIKACGIVLLQPSIETLAQYPLAEMQAKLIIPPQKPFLPNTELSWAWVAPQSTRCDKP